MTKKEISTMVIIVMICLLVTAGCTSVPATKTPPNTVTTPP